MRAFTWYFVSMKLNSIPWFLVLLSVLSPHPLPTFSIAQEIIFRETNSRLLITSFRDLLRLHQMCRVFIFPFSSFFELSHRIMTDQIVFKIFYSTPWKSLARELEFWIILDTFPNEIEVWKRTTYHFILHGN